MGKLHLANGYEAVLQRSVHVPHTIDDVATNKLTEPAYLTVNQQEGDVKVLMDLSDGTVGEVMLYSYSSADPAVIYKVFDTGTTIADKTKIQLFR